MKNIKLARIMREFTQLKVQMETGISQSVLSKYERGDLNPTSENLILLAKLYGTSVDYLLDLTDEKNPYSPKQK
ncbi:MAG: helix-turn-helix transcriptional regulator [Oscillospiraceae bacterium]|nr:helix-turn-helix transcriptional regulator [Oscillospiraceae bacterium]MBR2181388.1 helix-turn-helix transcriptional regulator [Oscillospiraceae bacterium]